MTSDKQPVMNTDNCRRVMQEVALNDEQWEIFVQQMEHGDYLSPQSVAVLRGCIDDDHDLLTKMRHFPLDTRIKLRIRALKREISAKSDKITRLNRLNAIKSSYIGYLEWKLASAQAKGEIDARVDVKHTRRPDFTSVDSGGSGENALPLHQAERGYL